MEKKKVRKLAKQFAEMENANKIEPLIQDNKIEFTFEKAKYRVRLPTLQERMELGEFINLKKIEALQKGDLKTEQELHQIFAKRGIDISKIEDKMIKIQKNHDRILEKIAKCPDVDLKASLKQKIIDLREEKYQLSIEKRDLLAGSLEQYLMETSNTYLLYLTFEKQIKDTWQKVFKTYSDLLNCQNLRLIYNGNNYLTALMTFDYV